MLFEDLFFSEKGKFKLVDMQKFDLRLLIPFFFGKEVGQIIEEIQQK